MNKSDNQIIFTGEFFVPGKSDERIESDHIERYRFACNYVINKDILDIACGYGYAAPLIIKAGATKYQGVDINEKLIANASSLYGSDCIKYYQGDILSYRPNKLFDIIICFETIEHVRNYRSALLNLYSMLKTDGLLIISSPNRNVTSPNAKCVSDKSSNPYHEQEFTMEELKAELISVGFSVNMNDIYGQRKQSKIALYFRSIKIRYLQDIIRIICGDASIKSSPKVTKIYNKIPRYIIVIAIK